MKEKVILKTLRISTTKGELKMRKDEIINVAFVRKHILVIPPCIHIWKINMQKDPMVILSQPLTLEEVVAVLRRSLESEDYKVTVSMASIVPTQILAPATSSNQLTSKVVQSFQTLAFKTSTKNTICQKKKSKKKREPTILKTRTRMKPTTPMTKTSFFWMKALQLICSSRINSHLSINTTPMVTWLRRKEAGSRNLIISRRYWRSKDKENKSWSITK